LFGAGTGGRCGIGTSWEKSIGVPITLANVDGGVTKRGAAFPTISLCKEKTKKCWKGDRASGKWGFSKPDIGEIRRAISNEGGVGGGRTLN